MFDPANSINTSFSVSFLKKEERSQVLFFLEQDGA